MKQSQVKEDKSKNLKITMIEKQNSKINEQSKNPGKKGAQFIKFECYGAGIKRNSINEQL